MNSRKAELLMASVSLAWGSSYLLMKVGLNEIANPPAMLGRIE